MSSTELWVAVVGTIGAIVTGGGLKTLMDTWLAKRKNDQDGNNEASQQTFNQSLMLVSKLEARVEVVETAVAKCRDEHLQCEKRAGILEGQLTELRKIVMDNNKRLDKQEATSKSGPMAVVKNDGTQEQKHV